jgi:hypothetical protein
MRVSLLCWVALTAALHLTDAQTTYFDNIGIDAGENLVYMLLMVFIGINFCTPILYWLLRNYLQKWLDKAQDQMVVMQQRITERISDAGRNFSEKVRN